MIVPSTIVPALTLILYSCRWRNLHAVVGLTAQIDPCETAHRGRLVERLLHGRVREALNLNL
jgi:hypothetical protein